MKQHVIALRINEYSAAAAHKDPSSTLIEELLSRKFVERLLSHVGVDPKQFSVFLGLFRTLSEREEVVGGISSFRMSYVALFIAGLGILPWSYLLFAVSDSQAPRIAGSGELPESVLLMVLLSLTFVLVLLSMFREAASALFNPAEATVMAHCPIQSRTYAASKIAHLLTGALLLVLGLNLYPVLLETLLVVLAALKLAAFPGARWFFPVTHLCSALLTGLWTAFMVCSLYGITRRFVSASLMPVLVQGIRLLALGAVLVVLVFYPEFLFGSVLSNLMTSKFEDSAWAWFPPVWFAEIGRMGCIGTHWRLEWAGVLSGAASVLIICYGFRGFSEKQPYAGSGAQVPARRNFRELSRLCTAMIRGYCQSPLELGAFCFINQIIRRDWIIKRSVLTQAWIPIMLFVMSILAIVRFGMPSILLGQQSLACLLPHLTGLATMALCVNLPNTNFNKAAWIYLAAPIENTRAMARGIFGALWIAAAVLPQTILLAFFFNYLPWEEAIFITGFNIIVASVYLVFEIRLIRNLPFSKPPDETKAMRNSIYIQICWVMAITLPVSLHIGLWRQLWLAIPVSLVLILGAMYVLKLNLKKLEKDIAWWLYDMKTGSNQMFREVD